MQRRNLRRHVTNRVGYKHIILRAYDLGKVGIGSYECLVVVNCRSCCRCHPFHVHRRPDSLTGYWHTQGHWSRCIAIEQLHHGIFRYVQQRLYIGASCVRYISNAQPFVQYGTSMRCRQSYCGVFLETNRGRAPEGGRGPHERNVVHVDGTVGIQCRLEGP